MRFLIFIIIGILFFGGCGKNYHDLICENIADIREIMYEGECEDFYVSFVCGQREIDYKINGEATDLIPFGIITVQFNNEIEFMPKYELAIDDNVYMGEMQKNPYEENYMVDIRQAIDASEVSLKIKVGDCEKDVSLLRVDGNFKYCAKDIITILISEYKDVVKLFMVDGHFKGEVYIKIISGDNISREKFWYLNIVSTFGSSFALIISPYTGEIMSVQKNIVK